MTLHLKASRRIAYAKLFSFPLSHILSRCLGVFTARPSIYVLYTCIHSAKPRWEVNPCVYVCPCASACALGKERDRERERELIARAHRHSRATTSSEICPVHLGTRTSHAHACIIAARDAFSLSLCHSHAPSPNCGNASVYLLSHHDRRLSSKLAEGNISGEVRPIRARMSSTYNSESAPCVYLHMILCENKCTALGSPTLSAPFKPRAVADYGNVFTWRT